MKTKRVCSALIISFTVSLTASRAVWAEEPAPDNAAAAAEYAPAAAWRSLFDGKTLKNWKSTQFGGEGEIAAEDGSLVIDMGSPLSGVTWAGDPLPKINYEVELEARRLAGSDFFCALTFPVNESHASLVLGGWGGSVVGISSINGYDASENETTGFRRFEKDKWYKVRLKVTDQKIYAWIDDKQIAEVEHPDREMSVRIEVELSKPFGIATYQTQGAVRELKLRSLSP